VSGRDVLHSLYDTFPSTIVSTYSMLADGQDGGARETLGRLLIAS
jgi:hypothetical protein